MEIEFRDRGRVELVGKYGTDLIIANSARMSLNESNNGSNNGSNRTLTEADVGLIKSLMKNRHGTPFEMSFMMIHVECSIAVAREWFRHRIASYNEMSGRYTELEPVFYIPTPRSQVGKRMSYTYEDFDGYDKESVENEIMGMYNQSYDMYQVLLKQGVAKEAARYVLPVGIGTKFVTNANLRSWLNFCSLRNDPRAMKEIRELAEDVEKLVKLNWPIVHEAFVENGRVAA